MLEQQQRSQYQKYGEQQQLYNQKQQANNYTMDYQEQVLKEHSTTIIHFIIVIYFLFLLLDIALFNVQASFIAQSESRYLTDYQKMTTYDLTKKISNYKIFIDMISDISNLQQSSNPIPQPSTCNQIRYNCINNDNIAWKTLEPIYQMMQSLYKKLIDSDNYVLDDSQVFLASSNNTLSIYFDGINKNRSSIANSLMSWISSRDLSKYLFKILKIQNPASTSTSTSNSYNQTIKILLCGVYKQALLDYNSICLISPGNLFNLTSTFNKSNPIALISQGTIRITMNGIVKQQICKECVNGVSLESLAAYRIPNMDANQQDRHFLDAFPLSSCINSYHKIDSLIKTHLRVCNPPQVFGFLSRMTIFVEYTLNVASKNYKDLLKVPSKTPPNTVKFLVLSNSTFNSQETHRMKTFNAKCSYTLQTLILITTIWLLLLPILPLRTLHKQITLPVSLITRMCNTVKSIKSKDQLQTQIDLFNKLHMQINKHNHIFYSTIEYFKYFIWYRKWLYTVKNSKRKALLEEGLTLFGSADYAPVYMYIFQKQIEMNIKLAENFKKMRKITTQQFQILQAEIKFDDSISVKKPRNGAGVLMKKSGFRKEESAQDQSMDFCMIENTDLKMENRLNKQFEIMQIQKKNKRVVRFSNDHPEQQRVIHNIASKFFQNLNSFGATKNSQKQIQDEKKRDREQQDIPSGLLQSRQSRQRQRQRDQKQQQSQSSQHTDQNWNHFMKFDQMNDSNSVDQAEDQCYDLKKLSYKVVDAKLGQSYGVIYRTYEKMIIIKKMELDKQDITQIHEYINKLYKLLIERLRYYYKYIKHKQNQKQKIMKLVSRRRVTITTSKNVNEKGNGGTGKPYDALSCLNEEIQGQGRAVDVEFKEFVELQERYKIDQYLMERARLYQIKLLKTLNYPIQYKKLQGLCDSKNSQIRVQARIIMSQQYFQISPHADMQALTRAHENLLQPHTTYTQKQKTLKLIHKILKNREMLQNEQYEQQLILIQNYYNYVHKQFYFVVDLTDSYEVFRSTLGEIFRNMGQVDLYSILNLAMNQNLQDMVASANQIKPPTLEYFQTKFQGVYNETNRVKSVISTKLGSKKMSIQKDFNRIISKIQQQNLSLSKFIVLILGGQNQSQSKTHQDYQSSSAQNRQIYQMVHQQILSKLQRNYFHVILVGFNLKDYQTRQGKLKKYVRHTHDLLEIDLSKPNLANYFKELAKFLNK